MRTTTELTARFNLALVLTDTRELDLANEHEPGSIEYWEAFEREEAIRHRGEMGLLDALDFDTVPFEEVEADLSLELFEQDLAEERAADYGNEDFEFDRGYESDDTYCKRRARIHASRGRYNRIGAALVRAKELYPHMNWEPLIGLHNAGWDVLDKTRR